MSGSGRSGQGPGGGATGAESSVAASSRWDGHVSTPASSMHDGHARRGLRANRCDSTSADSLPAASSRSAAEPGSDEEDGDGLPDSVCIDDLCWSEHFPQHADTLSEAGTVPLSDTMSEADTMDDDLESLPTDPGPEWEPELSVGEWEERLWMEFPGPLRRWIEQHEPSMHVSWHTMMQEHRQALPRLSSIVRRCEAGDRRSTVQALFKCKRLFEAGEEAQFESMLCGFSPSFGHVQFRVGDNVDGLRAIMGVADCFLSLLDSDGFPDQVIWDPSPRVEDPLDFQAQGLHTPEAQAYWQSHVPHASKWVQHWIQHKVWFAKSSHKVDHSAKHANFLNKDDPQFDPDKFDFMAREIADMVKVGALKLLPDGILPDVLTRLSLAPKPGVGELWRVIMDMRPENKLYADKRVRMEHLGHFSTVFRAGMLLFSCDLKSAYFSLGVDERVSRTMGFLWEGQYYKFTCCPFGWKLAPYSFIKVGRQILRKWREQGPGRWRERCSEWDFPGVMPQARCMQFIDDNAAGHKFFPVAVWLRNAMLRELLALGFSLSAKGELLPFPQLTFLGMIAHLACPEPTWHWPAKKQAALLAVGEELIGKAEQEQEVLCRQVGKYVGKLVDASRPVPVSRLLFREVNACIYGGKKPNWGGTTKLSKAAVEDMRWIARCFGAWNAKGSPIWVQSTIVPLACSIIGDAGPRAVGFQVREHAPVPVCDALSSLPATLAKRWADHVMLVPVPDTELSRQVARQDFCVTDDGVHSVTTSQGTIELTDAECDMHHVHKELFMVLLVLRAKCSDLRNRRVGIFVDAVTTVAYLCNWGGPSLWCCRMVKRVWSICARFGIRIVQVSHIKGTVMITAGVDALSRPYKFARGSEAGRDDWRLMDYFFEWLQRKVCVFTIDRMASRSNTRCKSFCSMDSTDPDAEACSAFAVDWTTQRLVRSSMNYCFPPFSLIPRVLQHIRECGAWAVVVVPDWPSQSWWGDLASMAVQFLPFPEGPVFETVSDGQWQPVIKMSFRPLAVVVSPRQVLDACRL